jgi:mannose-1-phosphate guanylyltransferase
MKAMILAAGFGTRFRPVTYTLPKPLVPLCNRPLIGWAVDALLAAGIRELIVNLHHLPEPLEQWLRTHYAGVADFEFSFEPEILGTGGGVRKVRALLAAEDEFLLVNGDTIQTVPFDALRSARAQRDAIAALTLRHPPEGDRFTAVYFHDGRITGFGRGTGEPLMFSGSHLISRRIFDYLPDKDFSGIDDEVYQPLIDSSREVVAGVVDDALWFDVGSPRRYMSATRAILGGRSIIDDSATVTGSAERSVIGAGSTVAGALHDSVIWDDCRIGDGVTLDGCIVAHGVALTEPLTLRNQLICRDDDAIPREGDHRFAHGLVLRDI